jgi:hypothetical protein
VVGYVRARSYVCCGEDGDQIDACVNGCVCARESGMSCEASLSHRSIMSTHTAHRTSHTHLTTSASITSARSRASTRARTNSHTRTVTSRHLTHIISITHTVAVAIKNSSSHLTPHLAHITATLPLWYLQAIQPGSLPGNFQLSAPPQMVCTHAAIPRACTDS